MRNTTRTRLGLEPLEARENPAGNVTASLINNQLFVTGDGNSNQVSTQQDAQGFLYVIGVNGTLVNGVGAVALGVQQGLTDGIFVGGGGNDSIDIAGLRFSSGLSVRTGTGSDLITLRNVSALYTSAYALGGNDMVQTTEVTALIGADFDGGDGFDIWENNGVTAGTYSTNRGFERFIGTGGVGGVSATLTNGVLTIRGDAGDNAVSTQQDASGGLFVFGANGTLINGQPFVFFGRGVLTGLNIQGNGGNDQFDVAGLIVDGTISITTTGGDDFLQVRATTTRFLSTNSGFGNDTLQTSGVIVQTAADFDGGVGFDIWNGSGGVSGSSVVHRNFELLR